MRFIGVYTNILYSEVSQADIYNCGEGFIFVTTDQL